MPVQHPEQFHQRQRWLGLAVLVARERIDATAENLGRFALVKDVEPITQPVYAVMHQRHRPQRMFRRLTRAVTKQISGR